MGLRRGAHAAHYILPREDEDRTFPSSAGHGEARPRDEDDNAAASAKWCVRACCANAYARAAVTSEPPSNGAAARDVYTVVTSIIILAGASEATLVAAAGRAA